ncbi:hypothetical protein LTR94_026860, partial [Friedmanniomyces endolithicus]
AVYAQPQVKSVLVRSDSAIDPHVQARDAGFAQLADASPAYIWILDAAGSVIHANGAARSLQPTDENKRNVCWPGLWPDTNRFSVDRALSEANAGRPFRFRTRFRTGDGADIYLDTTASPIRDADGRIQRLLIKAEDVTAQVETAAFLNIVIDVLPLALTVKDARTGRYILANRAAEALFDQPDGLAGLRPADVQFALVNDDSINAFVAGGQIVYIHTGLIQAADNANQVQGVIAHELGHIADGHIISGEQAQKPAMGIYLLSMVLGLAAMAAGGGEAGAGILAAGQQAALGKYLSFTRVQEATADASAVRYLNTAGITGQGMLAFFKKLQQQAYRYGTKNIDPFMQSHPLSGTRIQTLTADLQASPSWNKPSDPAIEERFRRVKAKLDGYLLPPAQALQKYPE